MTTFRDRGKWLVNGRQGGGVTPLDCQLSRYAAYLVAMNGGSSTHVLRLIEGGKCRRNRYGLGILPIAN